MYVHLSFLLTAAAATASVQVGEMTPTTLALLTRHCVKIISALYTYSLSQSSSSTSHPNTTQQLTEYHRKDQLPYFHHHSMTLNALSTLAQTPNTQRDEEAAGAQTCG